jgi:cyclophilin family peptidyl-prolyl cis-trans isomerase
MSRRKSEFQRKNSNSLRSRPDGIQVLGIIIIALSLGGILWMLYGRNNDAAVSTRQWSGPPAMTIDRAREYFATVKMKNGGEFVIQLHANKAPIAVNNFVFLAREGYYDGVTFHRVLDGFMAQGGDPTGTGGGGPGYQFANEDSDLRFDGPGVVAMANAGRDTNGSQFFITFGPQSRLDGDYTIFGQVVRGMDVVNGITPRDPDQNPDYAGDSIESVVITEQ